MRIPQSEREAAQIIKTSVPERDSKDEESNKNTYRRLFFCVSITTPFPIIFLEMGKGESICTAI